MQRAVSHSVREESIDYWTGTVYTTSRRVWEHDKEFKKYLRKIRCTAIDMETSALFVAGFANHIPVGALLLGAVLTWRLKVLLRKESYCLGFKHIPLDRLSGAYMV